MRRQNFPAAYQSATRHVPPPPPPFLRFSVSTAAADRRRILAELSSGRRHGGRRSGWRIAMYVLSGLAGLLLILAAGVWYWWSSATNDPRVVAIVAQGEQLRSQFFSNDPQAGSTGPMSQQDVDTMVTAMTSMRTQMEQLPSHLRPVAGMQIGQMFFSGMQQRVDDYFDSPPDQRQAMLDQQIMQMEAMRAAFAQGGFGGPPGNAAGNQNADNQNGQAGSPWARGNEGDRNAWRKRILDRTSPEQRAKWTEYRDAIDKRRQELGLGDSWRG